MQLYRWKAKNAQGVIYNGEFTAENENQVAVFVRENFGYVINIKPVKSKLSVQWSQQKKQKITNEEKELFFRQFHILLKSGIPILNALELLEHRLSENCADICRVLNKDLCEGNQLSKAMGRIPEVFPKLVVTLIQAGEISGNLNQSLSELANYYRKTNETKKYLKQISIYPMFLIGFTLLTFLFFVFKVLPMFAELYNGFDVEQSLLLKIISSVKEFPEQNLLLLFFILAIVLEIAFAKKKVLIKQVMKIPLIAKVQQQFQEIAFVRLLGVLLNSGVPIVEAIESARNILNNKEMEARADFFYKGVVRGISVADSAAMSGKLFSSTSIEFISIGESTGNLAEMLIEASEILEQDAFDRIQKLRSLVEPVLLVIISVVVLVMVMIVLTPMLTLITQMPE